MKHEDIMKERSNRVKDAISKHHYTFDALEKITGIPHSTMQRYVSGTTDKIPVTFYEAIATATSTPVEYLLCIDLIIKEKEIAPGESTESDDEMKDVEMIAVKATEKQWTYILNKLSQENRDKLQEQAELLLLKQQVQADKEVK